MEGWKNHPKFCLSWKLPIYVIAADGGTHNCEALGIKPDVIIGDLDSMDPDDVTTYRDAGVEVIRYPSP